MFSKQLIASLALGMLLINATGFVQANNEKKSVWSWLNPTAWFAGSVFSGWQAIRATKQEKELLSHIAQIDTMVNSVKVPTYEPIENSRLNPDHERSWHTRSQTLANKLPAFIHKLTNRKQLLTRQAKGKKLAFWANLSAGFVSSIMASYNGTDLVTQQLNAQRSKTYSSSK